MLLVEQNARLALQVSDHAYVLERGRIVLEGPSSELAADPRVQAAYLGGSTGVCEASDGYFASRSAEICTASATSASSSSSAFIRFTILPALKSSPTPPWP